MMAELREREMSATYLKLNGIVLGLGLVTAQALGAGCNEICEEHTDCTQQTCKECVSVGGGFKRCRSCCANEELEFCFAPCFLNVNYGQCQNIEGVDCSGIPELPKESKGFALWGSVAFVLGATLLLAAYRRKKLLKKESLENK